MTNLDWVAPDACTLPAADQPLRVAEFESLFAQGFRQAVHVSETRARLHVAGGDAASLAARARDLTARETSCCSFFTFDVLTSGTSMVVIDVRVPPARADVLAALVRRAEAMRLASA